MSRQEDLSGAEARPGPPPARRRGKGIATLLNAADSGGLAALERWLQQQWNLSYERKELLRFSTMIAIGVIDLGLVRRQGRYFALTTPALPGAGPPPPDLPGADKGQPVWVGGLTVTGLEW